MKAFPVLAVAILSSISNFGGAHVDAREISVASPAELKSALAAVQPGDVVTLKNGIWRNANLFIEKGGSKNNPLVIRAETPGQVSLAGSSSLRIDAPYVTVDGLLFTQGAISKGSVIHFNSHDGIVRDSAIVDFNPPSFNTNYYWVFFDGDNNLVDRCFFKGKSNMEPLVGNGLDDARHNSVLHSYFKDIPFNEANGREIFRIWGYSKLDEAGDDGAFFTIADNLFDHADGEGQEIISLKSNHNFVLRNTIIATRGGINIRRASFNTVMDNIILGQGVRGAYGLRMSGAHHLVKGNFASGCTYGIRVSCGEFIGGYLTPKYQPDLARMGPNPIARITSYPQVKYLTLVDNVMVNNTGPDLEIGSMYQNHWPQEQMVLIPEECVIQNNRFVRPHGGVSVIGAIPDSKPPLDHFSFKPNQYLGNLLLGGENDFAPSFGGFTKQQIPKDWSEAEEQSNLKPLTPADVGPDWMRPKSAF